MSDPGLSQLAQAMGRLQESESRRIPSPGYGMAIETEPCLMHSLIVTQLGPMMVFHSMDA